ncbi:MAG: hypothetical protein LAT56_14705 [Wenzhouxiangella sp.]|nr:hypothetical protein [Wenzhouxiangella sp.]
MSKRFTDTEKYKKPFIRSLQGPYKLLWDYLYHDCDHAGIWIVDFDIAQIYIGADMPVNKEDALKYFNEGEQRIVEFSGGKKWFIKPFIDFQYGELNPNNRVHKSVISKLKKENLSKPDKGLISPLQRAKDKDKDKFKDKDKDKESENQKNSNSDHDYPDQPEHKPDSLKQVYEFFKNNNASQSAAEQFYYHYEEQGWVKGNGMAITSWHASAIKWIKKDHNNPDRKIPLDEQPVPQYMTRRLV